MLYEKKNFVKTKFFKIAKKYKRLKLMLEGYDDNCKIGVFVAGKTPMSFIIQNYALTISKNNECLVQLSEICYQ